MKQKSPLYPEGSALIVGVVVLLLRLAGSASPSLLTAGWVAAFGVANGLAGLCVISGSGFSGFSFAATANHVGGHRERCGHGNDGLFHF
jgi:hypothetical protein